MRGGGRDRCSSPRRDQRVVWFERQQNKDQNERDTGSEQIEAQPVSFEGESRLRFPGVGGIPRVSAIR